MTTKASVPILMATLLAVAVGYAPAPVAFGATWTVTSRADDAGDATTELQATPFEVEAIRQCSR